MVRLAKVLVLVLGLVPSFAAGQTQLTLTGGDDDLRAALEAGSLLLRPVEEDTPRTPQDVVAAARADYAGLVAILYEYGFFAPEISILVNGQEAAQMSPFAAPGTIRTVDIRIDPGRAFRLGRAEIGPLAPGDIRLEGFAPGAPASTPVLRQAARAAIDGWRSVGYATAGIADQQITARHGAGELDVTIRIDPGPRVTFGPLSVSGNRHISDERVREIAGLPRGRAFDPVEANRAAERLRDTGVFSSVTLTEGAPTDTGTLPITAELVEAPLRRVGGGAELSSEDGLTLTAYWLHRNLLGGGERLRFDTEISGIGQGDENPDLAIIGRIERPATPTPTTSIWAEGRLEYLDEPTFRESLFNFEIGRDKDVGDDLTVGIGLGFRFSDISDAFGDRQVLLLTFPVDATYDQRDDPLDPDRGYFGHLELTPFTIPEHGDFGAQIITDTRGYLSFGEDGATTLAARIQTGNLFGGDVRDLPPDYLFYSGGGGTVRGQDYHSLGAVQRGEDSGGRGLLTLSGELRQDVSDRIGIVGFADAGYVSAEPLWDGDGDGEWHSGAGIGLRYQTPFGALRLDVATPISGDDVGEEVHFYIGIGQSF